MSVYHNIRGSMQPTTVEEDVDQDGLVLVDLNADPEPDMPAIHPASDRVSGQVSKCFPNNNHTSHLQLQICVCLIKCSCLIFSDNANYC